MLYIRIKKNNKKKQISNNRKSKENDTNKESRKLISSN